MEAGSGEEEEGEEVSKKPGAGQLARIGLYQAIAHMFGAAAIQSAMERRNKWQGMPRRLRYEHPGASGSSRAGFKMVKRMMRRPANRFWVKLHPRPIHAGENRGHSSAYIGKWANAKPGPCRCR